MIARVAIIVLEVAALGAIYALVRWANAAIDLTLAGAMPAATETKGRARTAAAAEESPAACSKTPAGAPPASLHRWPVSLYVPCARGFVAHQFEVEGELGAAHVALYRVPRPGMEARA